MIQSIYTDKVNILRRESYLIASRDSINNPVYGTPTSWNVVYSNIYIKIGYSGKQMKVSTTGELIYPSCTGYYSTQYILQPEDRIIIVDSVGIPPGIEYVVESVYPSYLMFGILDHYQFEAHLPI